MLFTQTGIWNSLFLAALQEKVNRNIYANTEIHTGGGGGGGGGGRRGT